MSILIYGASAIIGLLTLSGGVYSRSILRELRSQDEGVVFSKATNELSTADIVLVIFLLLTENLKGSLGLHSGQTRSKPRAPRGNDKTAHDEAGIPNVSVTMPLVIAESDIRQYLIAASLLESGKQETNTERITNNNAHLALFLAAMSNPALLLLLARTKCPIDPLGAVNVRNRVKIINRRLCCQITNGSSSDAQTASPKPATRTAFVIVHASPLLKIRQVKRGREVDVKISIRHYAGAKEDGYTEIFEQIFTVLEFAKSTSSGQKGRADEPKSTRSKDVPHLVDVPKKDLRNPPQLASYFKMRSNEPTQWARLCKDYNPIHISSWAAKLFGFRSKIAHGNHVAAKAVTVLTRAGDQDFANFLSRRNDEELWMEVEFKRPVLLPSEVGVRSTGDESATYNNKQRSASFEVFKGEKVHADLVVGF